MLPSVAAMWAITVLFEKPLLSVGLNLFLVIPSILVANTPLWIAYPYCLNGATPFDLADLLLDKKYRS